MIQIICKSESYTYNAYHILKAFYPSQEVSCKTDEKASNYVMVHLPDDREISVGFENTVEITDTAGRDESTAHSLAAGTFRPYLLCQSLVRVPDRPPSLSGNRIAGGRKSGRSSFRLSEKSRKS